MEPSSWIEISQSALRDNIRVLKRIIGPRVEFCSVVKANAYGHGLAEFVPLAERCGVRRFGVFSAEEAATLVECRTADSDVMIMGALENADVRWAVENGLVLRSLAGERLTLEGIFTELTAGGDAGDDPDSNTGGQS